jgi:hypothetical protein
MCKPFNTTFSIHPDIVHPRKRYTHQFVTSAFDSIFVQKRSLKATGKILGVHPQTIQKWINNFSSEKQGKALCFSPENFNDYNFNSDSMTFARCLWDVLKKTYTNVLSEATKSMYLVCQGPLY